MARCSQASTWPPVDGQLRGAQAEAQGAEAAAGGDGGELAVVADQHHLGPRPLRMPRRGASLRVATMAASSTTSTVRSSSSSPARPEVQQQPVDRAGVGEAFLGQADGGDPGRGGSRGPGSRPARTPPGPAPAPRSCRCPARPTTTATPAPPWVRSRTMAAWSSPAVAWRSRTWRTTSGPDHGAALVGALGGAVDQLPLQGQQLRRREPLHAQPAVVGDPDGPLGQEPVGGRLDLGERLLRAEGRPGGAWPGRPPRPSG